MYLDSKTFVCYLFQVDRVTNYYITEDFDKKNWWNKAHVVICLATPKWQTPLDLFNKIQFYHPQKTIFLLSKSICNIQSIKK